MMDTSGDLTVESTKTKRIARACDTCYKRKIKCDAAIPRCNWCAHHGSHCTYERRVVRKKASSKEHRTQLLGRIDRLEQLLTKTLEQGINVSSPSVASTEPPVATAVTSPADGSSSIDESQRIVTPLSVEQPALGTLHFAGWRLGSVNSSNGIPVFSAEGKEWIRSRTGEDTSLERISALSQSWHSSARSTWGVPMNMINMHLPVNLPDRQLVEKCLDLYHHSFACHIFPVVDPIRFRTTIATAYSQASSCSTYKEHNAQACVYAFLAFTSFFDFGEAARMTGNAEEYALRAHRILTVSSLETAVETLQAGTMMMMFHLFSGNLQYALFQASVSARMIFMLGAHITTYPSCIDPDAISANPVYRERYLLRNIFWIIFALDKELSLRTGQPPCLQEEYCDISLPPPHVQELYPLIMGYKTEATYDGLQLFPGQPWLSIIKSKAYSALYSTRAVTKTDAELLKDIRELDDDLERWRLSIPLTHRPMLSFTGAALPESATTMLSVLLHLDYNHCVAAIHQATSRCQAWSFGDHDEAEGVGTSFALSIEASRSSLLFLQIAHHLIDDDSFWMILYYPMSAILTLFYSILHRPLELQSHQDLELLSSVPAMIRKISVRRLTNNEINQIQLIDELVQQLTTLGRKAIKKARQEEQNE